MSAVERPTFTILLPIHRPPQLLPCAIASVLDQTRQDFELFVICDGAPPESAACAQDFAAKDTRIRAFVHPKGEGRGELYRDQALRSARGRYVCQIADDDLWFPNHLEEMAVLLGRVEFGNLLQLTVRGRGRIKCLPGDLARPGVRGSMLKNQSNFFGPTAAGYRLETYFRLPVGWSPAPPDVWSDLHMWRKFLSLPGIVCATRFVFTSLHLAANLRDGLSNEERVEENRRLLEEIQDPVRRDALIQRVMQQLVLRAELTNRSVQHVAAAGGADAFLTELQGDDKELLAELKRVNRHLTYIAQEQSQSERPARAPSTIARWLRWAGKKA